MKNLYLFIQINFIPFKVTPFFDSACISSIVSKQCPRSGFLSSGNSQKSHGAQIRRIWWLFSCIEFLAKWSWRTSAVWDGALSWCKNHELSAQNIFWNVVEWFSWNAIVKIEENHFQSVRKHKRNYVTNDDIDMEFGTNVSNSRTNIKI